MLWGGGEEIAHIVADVTRWRPPNAKAERPEPIPYRFETGQHTDRSDRNEFVELARCRHRAWRRASAVQEACGRRERIAEAAQIAGVRKRRKQDAGSNALPSPLRPAGTVSGWRAGLEHAASRPTLSTHRA